MKRDYAFQMSTSNLRFGAGATREIGMDLKQWGEEYQVERVLLVIDPALVDLGPGQNVIESMQRQGVEFDTFSDVEVEPTDRSFQRAIDAAGVGDFDAFVAVGGGSTIDTAKAANLYSTFPAEFLHYVNAPIGGGQPAPGPLKPLLAVPTTAGTGSETTGVAIFDLVSQRAKTGIAHRYLRPTLGIVDPENTRSLPAAVAASTGLDVLSHALESFTAMDYQQRPLPDTPLQRPAYQGANPISDLWAIRALEMVRDYLPRAVADPADDEARAQMMLAAAYAGIGFGNAGVHLPHGMSYPVAGMIQDFHPAGYDVDHALAPHGMSVIVNTPAVVKFTAPANPRRHLQAASALGAETSDVEMDDTAGQVAGELLAGEVIRLMKVVDMPNGLGAMGYQTSDIPQLVKGTLPQHRVTKLSPVPAGEKELTQLFQQSMQIWQAKP